MNLDLRAALNGSVRRLHHIQRYSSLPVIKSENVAMHSWQVSFISLLIGRDLVGWGWDVNKGALLERALCHDLSEAMSGDIIRSYKYNSTQMSEAVAQSDRQLMRSLAQEFGAAGDYVYDVWRTAKDDTPEGQIVAFADVVAVITYCAEEARMGNRHLDLVLKRAYENVIKSRWLKDEMLGRYVRQLFPTDDYCDAYRISHQHTSEFTEPHAGRRRP